MSKLASFPAASQATNRLAVRLAVAAVTCWLASWATHGAVTAFWGGRPLDVHVRWANDVSDAERIDRERRFSLIEGERREENTYNYILVDVSPANIGALVTDSGVEDTSNIDRTTFQPLPNVARRPWANRYPWVPTGLDVLTVLLAFAGFLSITCALLEFWQYSTGRRSSVSRTYFGVRDVAQRLGPEVFVFTTVALVFVLASMWGHDEYSDEALHFRQVQIAWQHDSEWTKRLTMLPGYHIAVANVSQWLGLPRTLDAVRLVTSAASAVMFGLFAFCATAVSSRPGLKLAQLVALPILLLYTGLVFTDVVALLGLVLACSYAVRGGSFGAALALTVTLLVRQNHVVWGALLAGMCWQARGVWPETFADWRDRHRWWHRIRIAWPFAIPLLAFGAFVAWNGGVAIGDADAHQAGLYPGNVIFASLLLSIFFAPQALASAWRQRWSRSVWVLVLVAAALVMLLFKVTHPYNQAAENSFLRNQLILWFASGTGPRLVLALGVALAAFALAGARVRLKWLLLVSAALSMVPFELIEQRYAIPAFAFFILLREPEDNWQEALGLALMTCLSIFLIGGVSTRAFNL